MKTNLHICIGINIYVCIYIKHIYAPSRLVHIKQTTLIHSQKCQSLTPQFMSPYKANTQKQPLFTCPENQEMKPLFQNSKIICLLSYYRGRKFEPVATVGMVIILLHREKHSPIIIIYEYLLPYFVIYVQPQNLFLFSLA